MNNKKTLWDQAGLGSIKFEIDEVHTVTFDENFVTPDEGTWEDGSLYCVFPVIEDGEERAIKSSAMGLLTGLKEFEPLAGKTMIIQKVLMNGKQRFQVKEQELIKVS